MAKKPDPKIDGLYVLSIQGGRGHLYHMPRDAQERLDEPVGWGWYDKIKDAINRGKYTQRAEQRAASLASLLETSRWIFPSKEADLYGVGQCVYFLVSDVRPSEIKIGRTGTLTGRIKQHHNKLGGVRPSIVAAVRTLDYKELERAFHATFDDFRHNIRSEWFERTPVMEYISEMERTND